MLHIALFVTMLMVAADAGKVTAWMYRAWWIGQK